MLKPEKDTLRIKTVVCYKPIIINRYGRTTVIVRRGETLMFLGDVYVGLSVFRAMIRGARIV